MSMLVSLAEAKTYLGISGTGDDAWLTQQITIVSDAIEYYCRRKFNAADYVQTFYRDDYQRIMKDMTLFHYPLIDLTEIVIDGVDRDLTDVRKDTQKAILSLKKGFFSEGEVYVFKYRAGYEDADIPPLLKSVVLSILQERYNKKSAGVDVNFGSDVQRLSIPGTISIDFDYSLTNNEEGTVMGAILGNYLNVVSSFRSERTVIGSGKVYIA